MDSTILWVVGVLTSSDIPTDQKTHAGVRTAAEITYGRGCTLARIQRPQPLRPAGLACWHVASRCADSFRHSRTAVARPLLSGSSSARMRVRLASSHGPAVPRPVSGCGHGFRSRDWRYLGPHQKPQRLGPSLGAAGADLTERSAECSSI